jgi:shikimate dehydrogenase
MRPRVSCSLETISLSDLAPAKRHGTRSILSEVSLIVHATPLGMKGEPFVPFDYAATPADCLFYDMIYTSTKTSFLAGAARLRRPFSAGLGMLLHQGAAAFELWTGRKPPTEVMRRALLRAT